MTVRRKPRFAVSIRLDPGATEPRFVVLGPVGPDRLLAKIVATGLVECGWNGPAVRVTHGVVSDEMRARVLRAAVDLDVSGPRAAVDRWRAALRRCGVAAR